MKKLDWFLLYITIVIGITWLRISRGYPEELVLFLNSFVDLAENIINYFGLTKLFIILKNIPPKYLLFLMGCGQIAVGFLLLYLFRPTCEQGAMLLIKKSNAVLKMGIMLDIMTALVIAIFIYSIVGLPGAAVIMLFKHVAVCFGKIPIAIFLGYMLLQQFQQQFKMEGEIYLYYIIGCFIMMLFETVYLIDGVFLFFVFPVFALGVDIMLLIYYFVYQCRIPVEIGQKTKKFDRNKIRDIIKKE